MNITQDQSHCPNRDCFDGHIIIGCDGNGCGNENCKACEDGIFNEANCNVCRGTSVVSCAFAKLYEAEHYVRRHEDNWDGNDASRPGVTMYSLAMWYRQRETREPLTAQGIIDDYSGHLVMLKDPKHADAPLVLHGVSWGYGGEGPTGLAAVLADTGFFRSFEDARRWVAAQPGNKTWKLDWMEVH